MSRTRGLARRLLPLLLALLSGASLAQADAEGRGREAQLLLSNAQADGLDPRDYAGDAIDTALARYLHDLRFGRVDPRRLGYRLPPRSEGHGSADAAPDPRPLAAQVQEATPPFAQYRQLKQALARYRALAADASLVPAPLPAITVRPGQPLAAAPALARWLSALGDLPAGATPAADHYDGTLSEAVRHFQQRHGLEADGLIGQGTREALSIALPQRVQQIELAMERLRWLGNASQQRFLAINIPNFTLWAWDARDPQHTPLTMGVIVGRALDTRTPVLQEEMRRVIFRPYWNVPRSILLKELLPRIRRDPTVLAREELEIVRGGGDDALPVPATAENLALLAQGALRLRQRPGERNSLGLVKFVFPNDDNVYLHSTPAQSLFRRARRDFSHGCVRVEDPVALAEWVLREQPAWTRERIVAAMGAQRPQQVALQQPIPVLLFYTTAFVSPTTGELHFADDLYGHDRRLLQALRAR